MIAVELDGHESHKSKEQRTRDAKRDRWFAARKVRTLRWTGSEVMRNPQESCANCWRSFADGRRGPQNGPTFSGGQGRTSTPATARRAVIAADQHL